MKLNKLLFVVCMFIVQPVFTQTFTYAISSGKNHIGTLQAIKTVTNDRTQISVNSKVKVKLFISIDFEYKLNATYKNGQLLFGSVTTYVNGKVHSTSTTEKSNDYYTIEKDGHQSTFFDKITYSGALLYFEEPKGISTLFSEFDTINKPIRLIATGEYQLTNPKNGRLSEYLYKNGILISTTNHHSLMTFTMTKQ